MASGVPCVATDLGDSALIVGDAGLIVPPRNVGALEAGIALMVGDPLMRRRLGGLARAKIVQRWPLREMARLYETLFDEVSSSRVMLLNQRVASN